MKNSRLHRNEGRRLSALVCKAGNDAGIAAGLRDGYFT